MEIVNAPDPVATPGTAIVEVRTGGVCSTDVMIYDWTYRGRHPIQPPTIIGHEATGVVVDVGGDVNGVAPGDRVGFQVIWGRPHSPQSMMGHDNLDPLWFHFGASAIGGAFASRVRMLTDRLVLIPDDVSDEDAVLLEPLACAVHAVELTRLSLGDSFLVIGPGPFGLLMCQIAAAAGAAHVIVVGVCGVDEHRLNLARLNGATDTILFHGQIEETAAAIRDITGTEGADAVVDAGGTSESTSLALEATASAGRVAMFGFTEAATIKPFRHVIRKGLVLSGVSVALRRHYGAAVQLIRSTPVKPSHIVTHRLRIDEFDAAVALMRSREATKVLLDMAPLHC